MRTSIFSFAILAILSLSGARAANVIAVASGNWSSPATWGGALPGLEDDVKIPTGLTVTLNADVECGGIVVEGRLEVERANRTLLCDYLIVQTAGAVFQVGTSASRFLQTFTLTLKGLSTEPAPVMGAKVLGAHNGGTLDIHGRDRIEWTHLGVNAAAGATSLTLVEPVDWVVGDSILVTSSRANWNEAETLAITAVSPDQRTVSFAAPLAYPHNGSTITKTRSTDGKSWTGNLRAEVGLLSRNVKIQGDAASETVGFGGHMMVMDGGPTCCLSVGKGYIEGVELYRMGQKSAVARYPMHWHMVASGGVGQYFRDSVVRHSFNRAITIHGTESTLVENNFCYDHLGHGLILEDGSERFNVIRRNVVLLSKKPVVGEEILETDNGFNEGQNRSPSSFWITNPNNTFTDNVAAGTEGTGFWFAFPQQPLNLSLTHPRFAGLEPHKQPLGTFDRNAAHSCMMGLDINDQVSSTDTLVKNGEWANDGPFYFNDCTWYCNNNALYVGIGGRRKNVVYFNNVFSDNEINLFLATYQLCEESLMVADSGYYKENNGDLYIRPVATATQHTYTITWLTNITTPTVDSDGDGTSDRVEAESGTDPFRAVNGTDPFVNSEFDVSGNFEAWGSFYGIGSETVTGGLLSAQATNGDPQMFAENLRVDGTAVPYLLVRMKASQNGTAELFWGRLGASGYSGSRVVSVNYTGGNQWRVLAFPMLDHADWQGQIITEMRFDPVTNLGVNFEIDWIRASDGNFISTVPAQTIAEDTATAARNFTLSSDIADYTSFTVTGTSSNPALVPTANIVISGTGVNRTVTVTPAPNMNGTATITLTASDGTLTASSNFLLTVTPVNDAPTITNIANRTINEDTNTGAVAFTIGDMDTALPLLTVSGSSSDATLVPNASIVFGGSGAARTVTVTPAPNQNGSATITISVSDGSTSGTDTFLLTVTPVNDAPTISDLPDQSINANTSTAALGFTIGDLETAPALLMVNGSSSNLALVPNENIIFGGSGANRIVTIAPSANQSGTATITLAVSDGTETASDTFILTVVDGSDALVATGSAWKYFDTGADPGATWMQNDFNDSAWPGGPAMLGFGDLNGETPATFVNNTSSRITTYFRHSFTVTDPRQYGDLTLRLLRDDGAVVWLNGVEVHRSNMIAAPAVITASTQALASVPAADENAFFTTTLDARELRAGTNVIAVEVHQFGTASDDLGFDLSLNAAATDITLTVQAADTLTGPWLDLASSSSGNPFAPITSGTSILETTTGPFRSVEVRDLFLLNDPTHPRRFMRLEITAP